MASSQVEQVIKDHRNAQAITLGQCIIKALNDHPLHM